MPTMNCIRYDRDDDGDDMTGRPTVVFQGNEKQREENGRQRQEKRKRQQVKSLTFIPLFLLIQQSHTLLFNSCHIVHYILYKKM